ncbi:hypothetical protein NRB20_37730 [Nocardia sp. RB20]|uniref:Uncharacterized protein n=1 Tax=Nocardia macrotermitis TaxID=2585198 RepID=A0A7K0D4I6_9NOCA|nr:hypothetical protein [Nocardia macrotermitis]
MFHSIWQPFTDFFHPFVSNFGNFGQSWFQGGGGHH